MRAGESEGRSPPRGSITSDRGSPAPRGSLREDRDEEGRWSAIGERPDARRPHCALHHQVHCERAPIYQGKQPTFRSERIDESFAQLMKSQLADEGVDLTAFRDSCTRHKLNQLETRYLDGIVEYCHGLNLDHERKRDLARARIESAMDLLIPFRTAIAEELRHALALRMNCFLGQWGCSESSPFQIAERFFCKSCFDGGLADDVPKAGRVEIAIDPVSRMILDALNA